MAENREFSSTIRQWLEVFTIRSMRDWRQYVRTTGLSMPQLTILMRLFYGGECGVHDIGRHLDVTNAAASQFIDRLVSGGLGRRSEDPADRRARRLTLTPEGRALIERGIEERYRWVDELSTILAPEERAALLRALPPLIDAGKKLAAGAIDQQGERLPQ